MTLEAFLARIYVDAEARTRFLADPRGAALDAGLSPTEAEALTEIDRPGLAMAARSFAAKRVATPPRSTWRQWLRLGRRARASSGSAGAGDR